MMRRIVVTMGLLLLALPVLPARAGGFCTRGVNATEGTGTVVTMSESCYTPTVLRTDPGVEVTFLNEDSEPHTVTAAAGAWGDPHLEVPPAGRMKVRFDEAGVYAYTCLFHPGMTGTVVVGDVASTGKGAEIIEVPELPDEPATTVEATTDALEDAEAASGDIPGGAATTAMALGAALPALTAGYVLGRRRRRD